MELANEADQNAEADVKAEVDQYREEHDLDLEVLNGRHNAADAQLALTAPIQQSVLTAHENRKKEVRLEFCRAMRRARPGS